MHADRSRNGSSSGALARGALVLVAGLLVLFGCSREKPDEIIGVGVEVLNYSDYDVFIAVSPPDKPELVGGGSMGRRAGGGKISCCFGLPAKWRPGLKVLARYKLRIADKDESFEQIVELPPYPRDTPGVLYVAVYGPNDIEVFSSVAGANQSDWPGRVKSFPGGER